MVGGLLYLGGAGGPTRRVPSNSVLIKAVITGNARVPGAIEEGPVLLAEKLYGNYDRDSLTVLGSSAPRLDPAWRSRMAASAQECMCERWETISESVVTPETGQTLLLECYMYYYVAQCYLMLSILFNVTSQYITSI